jgi:uncharacterized protein (DUF2267 family)
MDAESKGGSIEELPIEIKDMLKNTDFPISKNDLVEQEKKRDSIADILRILGMLPNKKFNSAEDVAKELHRIFVGIPSQA